MSRDWTDRTDTYPYVSRLAQVHPGCQLEASVHIGDFSIVEKDAILGGEVYIGSHTYIAGKVCIGARSKIGNYVQTAPGMVIGEDVIIGPRVLFLDEGEGCTHCEWVEEHLIRIGNMVVIEGGVIVMPGAHLEDGILVRVGALLNASWISGGVVLEGCPAGLVVGTGCQACD